MTTRAPRPAQYATGDAQTSLQMPSYSNLRANPGRVLTSLGRSTRRTESVPLGVGGITESTEENLVAELRTAMFAWATVGHVFAQRSASGSRGTWTRVNRKARPRLARGQLLGAPIRAQQTVDVEIVGLPTTHAKTPQTALAHKPAALKQSLRPRVVAPDEGVYAIDLVLSVRPLKDCGHGLAHQSLAPVRLRQVERQFRPAVYLRPLLETAGADNPIIVWDGDSPFGELARRPPAQIPLDHLFDQRPRHNGIIALVPSGDAHGSASRRTCRRIPGRARS